MKYALTISEEARILHDFLLGSPVSIAGEINLGPSESCIVWSGDPASILIKNTGTASLKVISVDNEGRSAEAHQLLPGLSTVVASPHIELHAENEATTAEAAPVNPGLS